MINAFCFFFGNDSWSRHGRNFFAAWQKQEDVRLISWNQPEGHRHETIARTCDTPSANDPGIGLGPIERMETIVGAQRIAFVVWETTIMPADKVRILREMDRVWTPSRWGRQLLIDNGLDANKVSVVPEGVDVQRFRPSHAKQNSARPFRFLFVGKWEVRKGIEDLIVAFCSEFDPQEPVELVVHGTNPYLNRFNLAENIRRIAGNNRHSIVASQPLAEDKMVDLYNSCDAFILPSRAEGWGLPITEAMACELPVIVTEYSAPLDFLNEELAYLIPVQDLVPVYDPFFFNASNALGVWAQPDLQSVRKLMRHVYENPAEARAKGQLARAEVCRRWTWDHAVTIARGLLQNGA